MHSYLRGLTSFNANVKLLLLRTIAMGLFSGIYGIIFNLYILDLGFRADFLGLLLAASLLTSSLTSIPAGILCDRMDRRKLMLCAGALAIAALVPVFLFRAPPLLLAFSALYGAFSSISAVCLTPLLAENCGDETVHVFSANASLGWIATVIGCSLGGLLPGLLARAGAGGRSFQMTLLASAALLAVACALLLLLKACPAKARPRGRPPLSLASLRPSPTVLKFVLTSVTFGVASGMIVPYFNVYFVRVTHMGVLEIGLTSAAAGAFMILGFAGTPLLTGKIGKVRSAVLTKLCSAPFLLLMAVTTDLLMAAAAYVAYMFLINMAGPATTSFQMEMIHPREQGFAVGLMSTGSCLAVAASSFLGGLLIAGGNYLVPFVLTIAGYLATAALLYYYFRDAEPPPGLAPAPRPLAERRPVAEP